jgi:hypothetical protein
MAFVDDFLSFTEEKVLQPLIDALNSCWELGAVHKLFPGTVVKYCGFNIRKVTSTKTGKSFYWTRRTTRRTCCAADAWPTQREWRLNALGTKKNQTRLQTKTLRAKHKTWSGN